MPTSALLGLDTTLDCRPDVNLILVGPVTVQRSNPMDDSAQFPGLRPVDGILDVIDTEITSMNLTNGTVTLKAGADAGVDPPTSTCSSPGSGVVPKSCGAIAEQPTDSALAESFFDVWFEVDIGGGQLVYNHTALRVSSVLVCVPPVTDYIKFAGCMPLYDAPPGGGGVLVAYLTTAIHNTMEDAHYVSVEYSNLQDEQTVPPPLCAHDGVDAEQVIYTEPLDGFSPPDLNPFDSGDFGGSEQVDALANRGDAFFTGLWNGAPGRADTVDLLVSFAGDPPVPPDIGVYQETAAGAQRMKWAQFDLSFPDPVGDVEDVDGLELWGPWSNHVDPWSGWDANMFSLTGEPAATSVYYHVRPPGLSVAYVPRSEIHAAVVALGFTGAEEAVDVDALMVSDRGLCLVWDTGDRIIFSIRAAGGFHGGEIIKLTKGVPNVQSFLRHGGHWWNTAWHPSVSFAGGGVVPDEVDGIEAMPPKGYHKWGACVGPGVGMCYADTELDCLAGGGTYLGNGVPCADNEQCRCGEGCTAEDVRSIKDHGGTEFSLTMGVSGGIEARTGQVTKLEIDLDDAGSVSVTDTATVNCSASWSGTATVTAVVGNTVTVEFSPALTNQAYCTVTLGCGAEVCVRMIEGDMNRDGDTNPTDFSGVKLRFGQMVTDANCEWDFNRDGNITATDASSVKLRFGYTAPVCP